MYRVETHNNSKKYFEELEIQDDAIYITSNTSISNMIRELAIIPNKGAWRILDIENFIKCVYPKWTNIANLIKLKSQLRIEIYEFKSRINDDKLIKEAEFLNDNISMLLSDFILLIECGVRKINSTPKNNKQIVLKEIFNKLTSSEIFLKISSEVLNIKSFMDLQNKLIDKENVKINIQKQVIKKIYFYNLNYIDIKRYMIIEMLNLVGYEVIFRIPYFDNLKVVNKTWDMIYKNENLFDFNINSNYKFSIKEKIRYVNYLESGNLEKFEEEKVSIKNYREVYQFINSVGNNRIITFHKDNLESCIKREDLRINRHCYQSAVGRFLYNLYICKVKNNTVSLDFSTYRELVTSGWIEFKGWNGNKLSSYLVENAEYFSGIETIDDILLRIEKLKDLDEVSRLFEEDAKERIKNNRTKAFLSNPFRSFAYANLEKYKITANYLYEITLRLKRFILKSLNKKDGLIDVKEHFEDLILLFRNKYMVNLYNSGSEVEKEVVRRIYYILKNPQFFSSKMNVEELSELMNIYLSLKKKGEETDKKEILDETEDIFSIDQLEGVILRDKIFKEKDSKKLFLSDLSFKAFDKYSEKYKLYEKICSMNEIRDIIQLNLSGRNRETALRAFDLELISKKAFESYIKFSLANLFINFDGEIELSWIEGLRVDDSQSIILKQIESIYGSNNEIKQGLDPDDKVKEEDIVERDIFNYDIKEIKKKSRSLPEVAMKDLDFCGEKFLYSSILEEYPMYYSDFHNMLAFSVILGMLKNSIENGYIELSKYILPLFPQWEEVEKKNILDNEYAKSSIIEYKYFDGINYPKSLDKLYLLRSKYGHNYKIRNRYNKGDLKVEKYFNEFVDEYINDESINKGKHCRMCPYCYLCKKGDFAIDSK